ncbi:FAD-dependent oxidoreductase [Saccharopolyspora erythraea]|uniref:FAD-dependent oxidoreductase n=1 Tax=Saccharopolyspora erythraea TaxID=1836 RepID=UPI001E527D66|nr:FAD-dependent oxidoreductase [Saccharopolyspora erythraea]
MELGARRGEVGGGNQRVATGLAERLGSRVRLNETVRAIDPTPGGVVVRTDDAETTFTAVVVALPLGVVTRVVRTSGFPPRMRGAAH